ncbi:MAG: transporter substrate-binding domain-containing protein [Hyphomicrobiales bacterium]|nr:transporter substrate-binding domain-containing protein [Hyphomicrobiales bacterium]OQW85141.1 MAG: hypothetical protein BVN31_01450 [Proteobacteria bacterium ST_bin15]
MGTTSYGALVAIASLGIGLITGGQAMAADEAARAELAASGKLRVGVAFAPSASAFFVVKDPSGMPRGITVDLGEALAKKLGVPVEIVAAPNSGELVELTAKAAIDVAFMPVDAERKTKVEFGPAYFALESTCMVAPGSSVRSNGELNRGGTRVVGISNTTTVRKARETMPLATVTDVASVGEAIALMKAGQVEAVALSRDSLSGLVKDVPGARILDDAFQTTGIAIAVPKGRPAALAYASAFIEEAKANGLLRQVFDKAGRQDDKIAPAGARY